MSILKKKPREGQNPPVYVIHGKERKAMKRELARLKNAHQNYWVMEDLHHVYGSEGEGEKGFDELSKKINELEEKLSEKL